MHKFALMVFVNISSVLLLVILITGPLFVAKNMTKVAGVKSESQYLIVSQIEKFPNLSFAQKGNAYSVSFTKQGPSQAYLGVLIINNPTAATQTYRIERISGNAEPFFGEDLSNQLTEISVPQAASVSISLFSLAGSETESQTVEFTIHTTD